MPMKDPPHPGDLIRTEVIARFDEEIQRKTKRPRLIRVTGRMLISPPPSAAQSGD
jgi:hypothetical protein